MAESTVLYERKGRIAYITLNRPDSLNAMNNQMWHETAQAGSNSIMMTRLGWRLLPGERKGSEKQFASSSPNKGQRSSLISQGMSMPQKI
jgi:enoyl-CoA hydratase